MWQTESVNILRNLTNDYTEPYTYSDTRLRQIFLVSAQLVLGEGVKFTNDYTVDSDEYTISPDPTEPTKDNNFINLVCLKSLCIIGNAEFKVAARQSISYKDAFATVDTKGKAEALRLFAKEVCNKYEEQKFQHQAGNVVAGVAIVTPLNLGNHTGFNNGPYR